MALAIREMQQRSFVPDIRNRISRTVQGIRRFAFADRTKEEKAKEVLRTGSQMQPAVQPMRKSGSQEEAKTVVKEEKKKNK